MTETGIRTVLLIAFVILAGCSMVQQDGQRYVEATPIENVYEDVPEDAQVVSADNETIQNSPKLAELVREAGRTNGSARVEISESEAEDVRDSLSNLPNYDGGNGPGGYYIEVEGEVYFVNIIIEQ